MPRVALIIGIFFATLVVSCADSFAQRATAPKAKKVSEFETAGHCDLTARLDLLATEVQNNPGSAAYILTYAPEGDGPATGKSFLEGFKDYLVNSRGLDPERVKTIYGGRYSNPHSPKTELWMVPAGVRPPKPVKHETTVETFKGLFAYWDAEDYFGVDIPDEVGPGVGNTTSASFADMLNVQKNAVGYVVAYNGEDASPGAWRRVAEMEVDHLTQFNLDANRLKVVFGGHQKETQVQLWIMPGEAPPPVADAGKELPLAKAVKSLEVYGAYLSQKKDQIRLLNRITDILREHQSVRALVVVRLEVPTPQDESENTAPIIDPQVIQTIPQAPAEPLQESRPPDLTKLVESWRVELANTHKIAEERFIVVFAPAREYESDLLELWLVPKGQPLPDITQKPEEPSDDLPAPTATPVPAKRL